MAPVFLVSAATGRILAVAGATIHGQAEVDRPLSRDRRERPADGFWVRADAADSRLSPVTEPERLQFPYMVWAHTSATRSSYSLSQSGMPLAEPSFLDALGRFDLGHPAREALPALEGRLAELFGVDRERVIVALGASGGMHLCALRYFRPGSRVVADVPSYEPFRSLPMYLGADFRPVRRRMEDGWQVDPGEVRGLLGSARSGSKGSTGADSGRGHVFLANLHNPTGAFLERERMAAIAQAAERAGGNLISCEVYMEYVPNDRRVHAFEVAPNGISIGSLTKAYGLGPMRIGWIVLGEGLARERQHIVDMAYITYVDPPTATLRAGRLALDRLTELLQPLRVIERESRPMWERWLTRTEGIRCSVPEFGIIAFPRIEGVEDTIALSEYLAREHQVDVVPGEFFGLPGHLRIGCGVPAGTLEEGLARLERGIKAFRAKKL